MPSGETHVCSMCSRTTETVEPYVTGSQAYHHAFIKSIIMNARL